MDLWHDHPRVLDDIRVDSYVSASRRCVFGAGSVSESRLASRRTPEVVEHEQRRPFFKSAVAAEVAFTSRIWTKRLATLNATRRRSEVFALRTNLLRSSFFAPDLMVVEVRASFFHTASFLRMVDLDQLTVLQ